MGDYTEQPAAVLPGTVDSKELYLHLLKLSLIGLSVAEPRRAAPRESGQVEFVALPPGGLRKRLEGRDWPVEGFTMIGMDRLDNLQACVQDVIEGDVPGDLIETGTWRGGAAIFMRALLRLHDPERQLFVADSFEGLPPPDSEHYPADRGFELHTYDYLSVPLETVQENFRRFGVLDDGVRFVKGWFRDTLPKLEGHPWSLIRLDGDLYGSTMNALESLYPSLSPGGYVIVDDYGLLAACRGAVQDYREANGILEEIVPIDWTGVYWRKEAHS
jgi:hypothetical protein